MGSVPELDARAKRQLELDWKLLVEKHGIRNGSTISSVRIHSRSRFVTPDGPDYAGDQAKVETSISISIDRFNQVSRLYLVLWRSCNLPYEVFEGWLSGVQGLVEAEVSSLWGTDLQQYEEWWAQAACDAVRVALNSLLDFWTLKALEMERARFDAAPTSTQLSPRAVKEVERITGQKFLQAERTSFLKWDVAAESKAVNAAWNAAGKLFPRKSYVKLPAPGTPIGGFALCAVPVHSINATRADEAGEVSLIDPPSKIDHVQASLPSRSLVIHLDSESLVKQEASIFDRTPSGSQSPEAYKDKSDRELWSDYRETVRLRDGKAPSNRVIAGLVHHEWTSDTYLRQFAGRSKKMKNALGKAQRQKIRAFFIRELTTK